ncbi:MAG: rRNA maturation RNase YbeY [Bdellovibrionota bacterium]
MKLELVNRSGRAVPSAFLRAWVRSLDRAAARKISSKRWRGRTLVIAFVDENEIRRLNREFRGKNKTTDVLSFESEESDVLGELAICPQVISRQAKEHGLLVREELGYMVLHGFLHLLGFDHETSVRDEKKMFALQDELFEELR